MPDIEGAIPISRPLRPRYFWPSVAIVLLCVMGVVWLAVASVPVSTVGVVQRGVLLGIMVVFALASLAGTEIIPPKGAKTWEHLRQPKVLGQLAFLLLSTAGFIVGISTLFTQANQQTVEEIQATVEASSETTEDTAETLGELDAFLRAQFPDQPAILSSVGGEWGDIDPACAVVWDIAVIQRGEAAALVAETVTVPDGVESYRFVGEIITAEGDTLFVEGVEPQSAIGSLARFTYNAATQRLSWDDRMRGSGGVEIYRRCE